MAKRQTQPDWAEQVPANTSLRLTPELRQAIYRWTQSQRIPPSLPSIVLTALQEFLEREGFPVDPE